MIITGLGGSVTQAVTNVTSHGKTYTNAFPLNGLKRWQSVGYPLEVLEKALEVLGKPVGGVEKSR